MWKMPFIPTQSCVWDSSLITNNLSLAFSMDGRLSSRPSPIISRRLKKRTFSFWSLPVGIQLPLLYPAESSSSLLFSPNKMQFLNMYWKQTKLPPTIEFARQAYKRKRRLLAWWQPISEISKALSLLNITMQRTLRLLQARHTPEGGKSKLLAWKNGNYCSIHWELQVANWKPEYH